MDVRLSFQEQLAKGYGELSPQLRAAAEYISANPEEAATRSLRTVAAKSGLSPPTYSRLARALGFTAYEDLRELCRGEMYRRSMSFAERAQALQAEHNRPEGLPFAYQQAEAAIDNIQSTMRALDMDQLESVVDRLVKSEQVYLVGALGSSSAAHYMGYMASYALSNWHMVGNEESSLTTDLANLGARDAVLIITKNPNAQRSIHTARLAHEAGSFVAVVTDGPSCPALPYADQYFIVQTDSPQFFSSYVATITLLESLMGMVILKSGPDAQARIDEVEKNNHRLGVYWAI